jgi:hypothetical protein
MFLGSKVWQVLRADNLTADCLDSVGSLASLELIGHHGLLRDSFSVYLAHPDCFSLGMFDLPTSEARCLTPHPVGVLELLRTCSGVSELLTLEIRVIDVTTSLSLPLAGPVNIGFYFW